MAGDVIELVSARRGAKKPLLVVVKSNNALGSGLAMPTPTLFWEKASPPAPLQRRGVKNISVKKIIDFKK